MNIGERIKHLRTQKNINQTNLAAVLQSFYGMKTDRVAISKWETGFQLPGVQALRAISDYFGVSVDYLMNGTDAVCNQKTVLFYKNYPDTSNATAVYCDVDADICISAPDNSMRFAGIVQGAYVFINTKTKIADGDIVVVTVQNKSYIRRCYINGDSILLVSEDGATRPNMYPQSVVDIVGKICSVRFDFN